MKTTNQFYENGFHLKGTWYDLDYIKKMYLEENLSQTELCKILNISRTTFIKIINHYGLFKDPEIVKNNRKQALIDKYGVDSPGKVPEFQEKIQQTFINKYGSISPLVNDEIKKKTEKTMFEKYGVRYPSQSKEIIQKKKDIYYEKYGVNNHLQRHIKHFDIWNDDSKLKEFLQTFEIKPTYIEIAQYFNVDRTAANYRILGLDLEEYINVMPGRSHYEDEIIEFLHQLNITNIEENNRVILDGKEIDIYLPDYKMGIEFNGDYWHSDLQEKFQDHNGRSTYHQEKSLLAESKGIFLFHIFEYEWNNPVVQENIKSRLRTLLCKNSTKIPARKCSIVELSKETKKNFLNENHIQGNDHSTKQYGLLYNDELVACMTFVHPKNDKYTWELSRFCNKHECSVQGGASKLFKYFISKLNKGDTISSYNDITKTKGDLYKILGFECVSINQPNYVWENFDTEDIRTRYQEQAGGEVQRMHELGYNRICDCGTKTWVYIVE